MQVDGGRRRGSTNGSDSYNRTANNGIVNNGTVSKHTTAESGWANSAGARSGGGSGRGRGASKRGGVVAPGELMTSGRWVGRIKGVNDQ